MRIDYTVADECDGKTVLWVLKSRMKISSRLIKRLKTSNGILLNNEPIRTIDHIHSGDRVSVIIDFVEETDIEPEDQPVSVIFEDDCFLAVDKGPNTPIHPTARHTTGTLAHFVMAYFQKQGLSIKIRPINRLDKDTSGVVLFAKNPYVQEHIIRQMKENKVYKSYLGLIHGIFKPEEGIIDLPIARKDSSIIERVIDPSGDRAVTKYKTLEKYNDYSLVQFVLETGRTHQIRVHSSAMGHPIIGDFLYSKTATELIERQALHSHILSFDHPLTGERITLTAPIPEDIKKALGGLSPSTNKK